MPQAVFSVALPLHPLVTAPHPISSSTKLSQAPTIDRRRLPLDAPGPTNPSFVGSHRREEQIQGPGNPGTKFWSQSRCRRTKTAAGCRQPAASSTVTHRRPPINLTRKLATRAYFDQLLCHASRGHRLKIALALKYLLSAKRQGPRARKGPAHFQEQMVLAHFG